MGKAGDRWKEFIAKVKLMRPEGRNRLLLVGVYINVLLLILIDIVSFITFTCVVGCFTVSVLCVLGLLIHRLHE